MARLPSVSSNIPRDLRMFLDRVREAMEGGGPDALVSARQLVAAGIATYTGSGLGSVSTGGSSTPPRPENVEANGALANIMLTWNKPVYNGHAYAEVWAAAQTEEQVTTDEVPTLGQAQLVGMSPGVFFAHNLGSGAKRWYWVRFVNMAGEVGPYQGTEGILGETSLDPAYVLEVLTGAISEGQLYSSLSERIDLIDAAATVVGSVAYNIKQEADARSAVDLVLTSGLSTETTERESSTEALAKRVDLAGAQIGQNAAAVQTETSARADADSATAQQINTIAAQTQNNMASVYEETTARTTADSSTAQQINTIAAQTQNNMASVYEETRARTTADSSTAQQITEIVAQTQSNSASIQVESTARSDEDGALAQQIATISASNADGRAAVQTETTARAEADANTAQQITALQASYQGNTAAIYEEQTVRTTEDGSLASQFNQLTAQTQTTFAGVQSESTARVSEDEALAKTIEIISAQTQSSAAAINTEQVTRVTEDEALAKQVSLQSAVAGVNSAAIKTEEVTRASETSSLSSFTQGIQSTVGDHTASLQVQGESISGIEAKYTVKIDNGGHLTGYGLISTTNDGTPTSAFGIRADTFWLAPAATAATTAPTTSLYKGRVWVDTSVTPNVTKYYTGTAWSTTAQTFPFIVKTAQETINGVTAPAGVYIDAAFIRNGTISNAMIGNAAIDNAKINDVNAGKINAGYLSAARIEAGSITASKIDTKGLDIKDADGNVVFAAGTPLKSEFIDYDGLNNVGLFWNSNFTLVATDGRPAGCYASYSNSNKSTVSYQDEARTILKLYSATDESIGVAMAAFRCDPTVTYKVIVRVKSNVESPGGFYIRVNELDSEMTSGVKFIGQATKEAGGQTFTRSRSFGYDDVAITTAWVDYVIDWQPTATAKWASLQLLNYIQMGTSELHVDRAVIVPSQTKITSTNASTYIADAAITLAHIDTATITNLSSVAADVGEVTAGTLRSSDSKFVIDLTNKTISIET